MNLKSTIKTANDIANSMKEQLLETYRDRYKDTLEGLLSQAKESVKVLEGLQKEGLDRAKNYMQIPSKELAQKLTNEKVIAGLKKMGLATKTEVRDLERKVEELATELRSQIAKNQKKTATTKKSETETEATT